MSDTPLKCSCSSHVPLDVSVYAMNGKSIEIDNTDAEGRLVLAGMSYAISHNSVHRS